MKLKTFFEKFELFAEAPNSVQKMQELILQLAVQGKLVPQNPNDEPASVLLDKIIFEKGLLINQEKIKKITNLPLIKKDKATFKLPHGWLYVHLGECIDLISGQHLDKNEQNDQQGGLPYLTGPSDFGKINPTATRWTLAPKVIAKENDILITVKGAGVGKTNILGLEQAAIGRQIMAIRPILLDVNYIYIFILANYRQFQDLSTGSTVPGIGREDILKYALPLPPLNEQHRIVAKVNQLMALRDELEKRQKKKRETRVLLNNVAINQLLTAREPDTFVKHWQRICNNFDLLYSTPENIGKLRQAILQLAIMGKLIPQDSNDEPASVLLDKIRFEKEQLVKEGKIGKPKKLPSINLDEISYQLPKSWQWIRLAQIISLMDAGWSPACKTHPTQSDIQWGVLKTTAVQELEYKQDEHKELPEDLTPRPEYEVKQKDILITRAGPKNRVGICCLVQNTRPRLMISDKIIRFHLIDKYVFPNFIALCLNSGFSKSFIEVQKSGMAASQMNISQDKLKMVPVPIPPLAEQKRIVTKVDQLMDICNKLEAKLTQSQNDSEKLMDVAVRQLLSL